MTKLVAETDILLADPEALVGPVCEHLVEHGASLDRDGDAWVLTWPQARARLSARSGRLSAFAEAEDREALYLLRLGIASHVVEFAGEPAPTIVWSGDGGDLVTPPNFRMATVVAARSLTPHMRRVTLTGEDFTRFMTDDALHVKLIVPKAPGAPLQTPTVGPDGLVIWSRDEPTSVRRTYTIRSFDRERSTVDIDFVLHEEPGPGAAWALAAAPGDKVGIMGPGGGGAPSADWMLLAGDETALPAISRILEGASAETRGTAIIEVADPGEEQPLTRPAGVELMWLHRKACAETDRETLVEAVKSVERPRNVKSVFLWAGAEFDTFKALRAHARKTLQFGKKEHLVVAYWRLGQTEIGKA